MNDAFEHISFSVKNLKNALSYDFTLDPVMVYCSGVLNS